jgi:hypothetical protein
MCYNLYLYSNHVDSCLFLTLEGPMWHAYVKRRGYSVGGGRKYGKIRKNMSAVVWHQLSSYGACSPLLIISSCTHMSAAVRVLHAEGSRD